MLAKVVAELLLTPASFAMHGRSWFGKFLKNPRRVLEKTRVYGVEKIRKGGHAYNFFVYYPMRLGIEILDTGSLRHVFGVFKRFVASRIYRLLTPGYYFWEPRDPSPELPAIPLTSIMDEVIHGPHEVVCLPLFGGLLAAPAITGSGILERFCSDLPHAPQGLDHLAACLPAEDTMRSFCARMAAAGKRIAVAGLPGQSPEIVLATLRQKGFKVPMAVYLPEEGEELQPFLRRVAREEEVNPRALMCLTCADPAGVPQGASVLILPSISELTARSSGEMARLISGLAQQHPAWDMLWAIALEGDESTETGLLELDHCPSLSMFVRMTLAPALTVLVLKAMSIAYREALPVIFAGRGAKLALAVHRALKKAGCGDVVGEAYDTVSCLPENCVCVAIGLGDKYPGLALGLSGRENGAKLSIEGREPYNQILAIMCEESQRCHAQIRHECEGYAARVAEFAAFSDIFAGGDMDCPIAVLRQWLEVRPYANRRLFSGAVLDNGMDMEEFLDQVLPHVDAFVSTGFNDRGNELNPLDVMLPAVTEQRCAIHVHMHDGTLCEEFARYLRLVPFPFDLYITATNAGAQAQLETAFSRHIIPALHKASIWIGPNRGRDIWPWLEIADTWDRDYDLACHVHAKRSSHRTGQEGEAWRRYLLDNLLLPRAIRGIFAAFAADDQLGCVFPAIFPPLKRPWARQSLYGGEEQRKIIRELLRRMGMDSPLVRRELCFSAGTMMWYRPRAIASLFRCGVTREEFPPEPMPLDGTIAHAIERVIPLVALRSGYKIKTITFYESRVP